MSATSSGTSPQPGFSVALCTYNGARHLGEQLASIAAQTRLPDELVIRDDGSMDATADVVADFARRVPFRVDFEQHAANVGVTQNFAAALAASRGGLIALCDQDDVWPSERLERFARFFDEHPRCLTVFSDATLVDEALRPLNPHPGLWARLGVTLEVRRRLRDPRDGLATLADRYLVTGATLVVRRELLAAALPIPAELPDRLIHDKWRALVAAASGGLDSLPEVTLHYRQHDRQQVGLRAAPAEGAVPARSREGYGQRAALLAKIHALLADRLGAGGASAALDVLAAKAAFYRRRAERSKAWWKRIGPVLRDLRRGEYHRFCYRSFAAASYDLLT